MTAADEPKGHLVASPQSGHPYMAPPNRMDNRFNQKDKNVISGRQSKKKLENVNIIWLYQKKAGCINISI